MMTHTGAVNLATMTGRTNDCFTRVVVSELQFDPDFSAVVELHCNPAVVLHGGDDATPAKALASCMTAAAARETNEE